MSVKRLDWPLNPYQRATPGPADSAVQEPINLLTPPTFYPTFTGNAEVGNPSSDVPQAYDVKGARAVTVQIDSWNVTVAGTFQIQVSANGVNYAPLQVIPAGGTSPSTTVAIPTGGTSQTSAIATIVVIDAPWFNYMRILIPTPVTGTNAAGTLTITKRS